MNNSAIYGGAQPVGRATDFSTRLQQQNPASVYLQSDILVSAVVTVPVGRHLYIDLRGFATSITFAVDGKLTVVNGTLRSPISMGATGIVECDSVVFTSSVCSNVLRNATQTKCTYSATIAANGIVDSSIDGQAWHVDAMLSCGQISNSKISLRCGLTTPNPQSSLITLAGDWGDTDDIGSDCNIIARNVTSSPSEIILENNAIQHFHIQQSEGLSVLGRASNTTGNIDDIVAGTDGQVLRRDGATIGFGSIPMASVTGLSSAIDDKIDRLPSSTARGVSVFSDTTGDTLASTGVTIGTDSVLSGYRKRIISCTTNTTLTISQSGSLIDNLGADDLVIITLPNPTIGLQYDFHVSENVGIRVQVATPDTHYMMIEGIVVLSHWESYDVGDCIKIVADGVGWIGTLHQPPEIDSDHFDDFTNPHQVTAEQVGLGSVNNTADLDKPVSTATQSALDEKLDASLDNSRVWIGDEFDVPTAVSVSGDISINSAGVTLIQPSAITTAKIDNGAVTPIKMPDSAGLSVLGRFNDTTGSIADIVAGADGQVLRRDGATIGFGGVPMASVTGLSTAIDGKIDRLPSSTARGVPVFSDATGDILSSTNVTIGTDSVLSGYRKRVISCTANTSLVSSQSGALIDNLGADDLVIITLPNPTIGLQYDFHVSESVGIRVQVATPDTHYMMIEGVVVLSHWESYDVGDCIKIVADGTGWIGTLHQYDPTLDDHISDSGNPHGVTAAQVGLGNVNNTADLDKPISTATQSALDGKQGTTLTSAQILVGSSTNVATGVAMTGDVAIDNTGVATIQPLAITEDKIGLAAVSLTRLADNSVSFGKIIDGSIISAKISPLAVTSDKIGDGAVLTAKINDGAVTLGKMAALAGVSVIGNPDPTTGTTQAITATANGQVLKMVGGILEFATEAAGGLSVTLQSSHIYVGNASDIATAVAMTGDVAINNTGATTIQPSAITTGKINDLAVTDGKLAANAVTVGKINNNAVTTDKINDGAVTLGKMAALAGVSVIGNPDSTTGTPQAITATANGQVLKMVGGILEFATEAAGGLSVTLQSGRIYVGNASDIATGVAMTGDVAINNTGAATIQPSAVTTSKINDLAVTEGKLAASAVTTAKINNLAVTEGKLAASAVTTAKINDLAITEGKLAASAVTTEKINALAVTGDKLATDAVTTGKIQASAVTTAKINDSAVTADKIGLNAVTTAKIDTLAVTSDKIADGAVSTSKIQDFAVTNDKLGVNAVQAINLQNGAVTSGKIDTNAVTVTTIATSAVTTAKINDLAVTVDKIGANAVTTGKINDLAVTVDKLAASAVTESKIANNAVTANKIGDNAVTTAKIMDEAVTIEKIQELPACSIIGRSPNTTGEAQIISASTNGQFLARSGDTLTFATLPPSDVPQDLNTQYDLHLRPSLIWDGGHGAMPTASNWISIAYGNGVWVAVKQKGFGSGSRIGAVAYSEDGNTWQDADFPSDLFDPRQIVFANGFFACVGNVSNGSGDLAIASSVHGKHWRRTSITSSSLSLNPNGILYANDTLWVVARGTSSSTHGGLYYSKSVNAWTQGWATSNNRANWVSLAYGNGIYVAVGDRTFSPANTHCIATWTDNPASVTFTNTPASQNLIWSSITFGRGRFVAVASGAVDASVARVMTSFDGINWSTQANAVTNSKSWRQVIFSDGLFVAVAHNGGFATSKDGQSWVAVDDGFSWTTIPWRALAHGKGALIAVCDGMSVSKSGEIECALPQAHMPPSPYAWGSQKSTTTSADWDAVGNFVSLQHATIGVYRVRVANRGGQVVGSRVLVTLWSTSDTNAPLTAMVHRDTAVSPGSFLIRIFNCSTGALVNWPFDFIVY